jgi:hypothetical protein
MSSSITIVSGRHMNGDYIELAGAESELGIVLWLTALLTPLAVRPAGPGFPVLELENGCFAFVDFQPGGQWTAMLVIGHPTDDDPVRRAVAEAVYRKLAAATPWSLRWTSDSSSDVVSTATLNHTTTS